MKRMAKVSKAFIIPVALVLLAIFFARHFDAKGEEGTHTTSPGDYSEDYLPLGPENVTRLSELTVLTTNPAGGPIAVASYFPKKNTLLAVYTGDGFLRAWDAGNANILFEHDLGITTNIGAGLDQSGDLVMGAIQHVVKEDIFGELNDFIGGVTVWDTETGKVAGCIPYPCERTELEEQSQLYILGATLDPKGRWGLSNHGSTISVIDITNPNSSQYSSTLHASDGSYRNISLFAFDPDNDRYAIAFRDGTIDIEKNGENKNWISFNTLLGTYEKGVLHKVAALSFSPNGKFLARIQENVLTLWKSTVYSGDIQFEYGVLDGHLIAFDQSSEMLFVGTTDNIEVLDVKEGKPIGEFTAPGITSLSVSSDNRLLIWGDKVGAIHVWGIHK
jgi:hypothetical protein